MTRPSTPIRILLVDDSEHVLWGLGKLFEAVWPRMSVVGKVKSVGEVPAALRSAKPDVILLDIYLGEDNTLDYLPGLLRDTDAQVLVLTGANDLTLHDRAISLGARAVVLKDQPAHVLLTAILDVHAHPVRRGGLEWR